jgi:hypothetical protein
MEYMSPRERVEKFKYFSFHPTKYIYIYIYHRVTRSVYISFHWILWNIHVTEQVEKYTYFSFIQWNIHITQSLTRWMMEMQQQRVGLVRVREILPSRSGPVSLSLSLVLTGEDARVMSRGLRCEGQVARGAWLQRIWVGRVIGFRSLPRSLARS